jgi:hypothetical protein
MCGINKQREKKELANGQNWNDTWISFPTKRASTRKFKPFCWILDGLKDLYHGRLADGQATLCHRELVRPAPDCHAPNLERERRKRPAGHFLFGWVGRAKRLGRTVGGSGDAGPTSLHAHAGHDLWERGGRQALIGRREKRRLGSQRKHGAPMQPIHNGAVARAQSRGREGRKWLDRGPHAQYTL